MDASSYKSLISKLEGNWQLFTTDTKNSLQKWYSFITNLGILSLFIIST